MQLLPTGTLDAQSYYKQYIYIYIYIYVNNVKRVTILQFQPIYV